MFYLFFLINIISLGLQEKQEEEDREREKKRETEICRTDHQATVPEGMML